MNRKINTSMNKVTKRICISRNKSESLSVYSTHLRMAAIVSTLWLWGTLALLSADGCGSLQFPIRSPWSGFEAVFRRIDAVESRQYSIWSPWSGFGAVFRRIRKINFNARRTPLDSNLEFSSFDKYKRWAGGRQLRTRREPSKVAMFQANINWSHCKISLLGAVWELGSNWCVPNP